LPAITAKVDSGFRVSILALMAKSGAASAVFIMDVKGRVLIWRDYRGDVSATQAERFFNKLMDQQVSDERCFLIA
jgi:hypothetical protein